MDPLSLASTAMGLIGGIGKLFGRKKANKELNKLQAQDPRYTANPEAEKRLGLANSLLNARMPGAASIEKNIYTSGANANANFSRNAGDSTQALLGGAAIAGQQGKQLNDLGIEEANDYQRRYQNQVGAQQGVINEQDKVYNDDVRRFGDKAQIQGAISQNKQQNWQDFSNLGFGMADFGVNGGFGGLFGGKQKQVQPYISPSNRPRTGLNYIPQDEQFPG